MLIQTPTQLVVFEDEHIDADDNLINSDSVGARHVQEVFASLTENCKAEIMSLFDAFAHDRKSLMGDFYLLCLFTCTLLLMGVFYLLCLLTCILLLTIGIIASNCIPMSNGLTALFTVTCRINHR